jgi:hypothetical protein
MSEQYPEPTGDDIPDGTQLPGDGPEVAEEGDAGVDDTGTEEWYGSDEAGG